MSKHGQTPDKVKAAAKLKCIRCRGEMKLGATPFHIDRRACHITLDAVPARVCEQCGEAYFEEKEVDAIQELVKTVEEKAGALAAAP